MKINNDKLKYQSLDGIQCYAITGDEPLLVQEARTWLIKQHTTPETELIRITPKDTSWEQLVAHCQYGSLLAPQQLIDLRLDTHKLSAEASSLLMTCITQLPKQTTLMITIPKLDSKTQHASWIKAIDTHGLIIQIWGLTLAQLSPWIKERAKQYGHQLTTAAIDLIRDHCEGNVLAADQLLQKLTMVPHKSTFDMDTIQQILTDSNQYDIFAWVDACLIGDPIRMGKILSQLQQAGIEPTLLLWAFAREIRLSISLQQQLLKGHSLSDAMKSQNVYAKKKSIYQQLLSNTELIFLSQLLKKIVQIDYMIKGVTQGNYWQALHQLGNALARRELSMIDE